MDSMRSLNTSLPSARRRPQPPAQLLQAFKTAALQVTNLYKAAATDREAAHEQGYQAALDDMLSFLDNENLGVGDGEGWRVRQWVTEKLQEGMASNHIDSDDETTTTPPPSNHHQHDADKHQHHARSSSPAVPRRTEEPATVAAAAAAAPPPVVSVSPEPVVNAAAPERPAFDATLPKSDFTFRATQPLPAGPQADLEMDPAPENEEDGSNNNNNSNNNVQINVFPRHHGRANHHHRGSNNATARSHHARDANRNTTAATAATIAQMNNSLGQGAGLKRRAPPFGDFFDITGVGNGKDMFGGGGKRGRLG